MDRFEVDFDVYLDLKSVSTTTVPPLNRELTRDELFALERKDIEVIKQYIIDTFPKELSDNNFSCLEEIRSSIKIFFSMLQMGDIILAPGDSPYKLIKIINNVYDVIGVKFIIFPLSGIMNIPENQLDTYLKDILAQNDVTSLNNVKIMDYSDSGASIIRLNDSLLRIFGYDEEEYEIPVINTHITRDTYCLALIDDLFALSERSESRCMPTYSVSGRIFPPNNISKGRCATVIALISLYLMGLLN